MSQTYCLDPIIRKVDATATPSASQERVAIDSGTGALITDGWFRRMKGQAKYFLVTTDPRKTVECTLPPFHLRDFAKDFTVKVQGAYRVRCEPESAVKIVRALYDGNHPGMVLDKLIQDWVAAYEDGSLDTFLSDYFDNSAKLYDDLRTKAREQVGLNLDIRLQIDAPLESIRIGPVDLPVRLGGFGEEQNLKLTLHLDVTDRTKAILSYSRNPVLEQHVIRHVKTFFAENVSFQDFLTSLNKDDFRSALTNRLDEALAVYGRRVGGLRLESAAQPPPLVIRRSVTVPCKIQDYGEVQVNNTVELSLRNAERYRNSQSPNLVDWLEEKLENIIGSALFHTKYVNLLVDFGKERTKIEAALTQEADAIGYHVEHIITIPDLEPIKWKDGFVVKPQREYQTKDMGVTVKLQIALTAKIPDLRKVKDHLTRNLPRVIEEAVVERVARFLRSVDAERYYMRFSIAQEDEQPLVAELDNVIREELDKFSAEIIEVSPLPLDTDITIRLRELMKGTLPLTIGLTPFQGAQPVTVTGRLLVDGVDGGDGIGAGGWHNFKLRNFGAEELKEALEVHLKAELNNLPFPGLVFMTTKGHEDLKVTINTIANHFAKEAFGLRVRIVSIDRLKTLSESKRDDVITNSVLRRLEGQRDIDDERAERLRLLLSQLTALAGHTDVADETAQIQQDIKKIMDQMETTATPAIGAVERKMLEGAASDREANEPSQAEREEEYI